VAVYAGLAWVFKIQGRDDVAALLKRRFKGEGKTIA
jgi:hypothetical protein